MALQLMARLHRRHPPRIFRGANASDVCSDSRWVLPPMTAAVVTVVRSAGSFTAPAKS
jgi:hypothetical protein